LAQSKSKPEDFGLRSGKWVDIDELKKRKQLEELEAMGNSSVSHFL
jgi:hypothetical protein